MYLKMSFKKLYIRPKKKSNQTSLEFAISSLYFARPQPYTGTLSYRDLIIFFFFPIQLFIKYLSFFSFLFLIRFNCSSVSFFFFSFFFFIRFNYSLEFRMPHCTILSLFFFFLILLISYKKIS